MCGIAGYIGQAPLSMERVRATLTRMKNRGPDHQNYAMSSLGRQHVALLSARLAIVDLDERSNMPFKIGDYTIVYNGEIYNYVELRRHLIEQKIDLRTSSDTEVLLQYYLLYGERCVDHFEGMWSFAIHDPVQERLFLSRDRFGEKPLFYLEKPGGFYFGSEIKFLSSLTNSRLEINEEHVCRFLVNGYKALKKTDQQFFLGVKELPPGYNLTISAAPQISSRRYWRPTFSTTQMSAAEAREGVKERLLNSIKLRLRSDVPLAFCLSGGIDSNAIVAIAAKEFGCNVQTFSIVDPDPRYNEWDNISATINDLQCKNTVIRLTHGDFFERLRKLVAYHDAPVSTITYYVHSFLSEAIAEQGFKVVLSGTAADELLTGYYDHFLLHLYETKNHPDAAQWRNAWEQHIKPIVRNPFLSDPALYLNNPDFREHIYLDPEIFESYLTRTFEEAFSERTYWEGHLLRNRMLNELFHETIPVILHEDDLNSMLFSIENRSPYLDRSLFEFCYSIPDEHLINDGFAKRLLREAIAGYVNDTVRLCRRKTGFNAAVTSLIDLNQPEVRDTILNESPVYSLVDRKKVAAMLQQKQFNDQFNKFFFSFLSVKMFMELCQNPA